MKRILVFLLCTGFLGVLQGAAQKERSRGNTKQSRKMALLYTTLRDITGLPKEVVKITGEYHGGIVPTVMPTAEFLLKKPVSCIAFMGNRGLVVGNSNNNTLQFFDIETGKSAEVNCKQRGQITAVAHVSGFDIATGSKGTWGGVVLGGLRIWCVKTGELKANFDGGDNFDRNVSLLAVTNNILLAAYGHFMRTYDIDQRQCKGAYDFGKGNNIACFFPRNDHCSIAFSRGSICFFNTKKLEISHEMNCNGTAVGSFAYASNNELVVADGGDKTYLMKPQEPSWRPLLEWYQSWETKKPARKQEVPGRYPIKHVMEIDNKVVGIQLANNRNMLSEFSRQQFRFLDDNKEEVSFSGDVTRVAVSKKRNYCAVVADESHDARFGKNIINKVHVFSGKKKQEVFDDEYAAWIENLQAQSSCVLS